MLERLGLVFGQVPGFDQLIDERLVLGQLLELAAAQQVRAAVADLGQEQHLVDEHGDGRGRAHAAARALLLRGVVDAPAGFFHGRHQPARERVAIARRTAAAHGLDQDVDRHLARDLAGRGAAHAVAHGEDASRDR